MDQSISSQRIEGRSEPSPLMAPPAGALVPGTILREFELTGTLGEGGFSIVYAARDKRLGREVAIKEYIPSSLAGRDSGRSVRVRSEQHRDSFEAGLAGFINEARLLAQFKHPALVEVLQFWEENGTAYLAMPRYSGRTLRQVLKARPELAQQAWLSGTLAPVLDVLELLHSRSVFHRDVAPDNILIQDDGSAVLLDLGSAREILGDREGGVTVVVKPGYAPLEQYSGEFALPQGPWTDVYAFGATLYFALTGAPPPASISRVMKDTLAPLADAPRPGCSPAFLAGIDAALALQPKARPQSAAELKRLLGMDRLPAQAPASAVPPAYTGEAHSDEAITEIVSAEEMASIIGEVSRALDSAARSAGPPPAQRLASEGVAAAETSTRPIDLTAHPFESEAETQPTPEFADVADLMAGRLVGTTSDVRVVSESRLESRIDAAELSSQKPSAHLPAIAIAAALVVGGLAVLGYALFTPGATLPETPAAEVAHAPISPGLAPRNLPPASLFADATIDGDLPGPSTEAGRHPHPADAETGSHTSPWADLASHLDAGGSSAQSTPTGDGAGLGRSLDDAAPVAPADSTAAPATVSRSRAPAAPALHSVRINVQPWGEVWVDGRQLGVSPPIREIQLPAGRHRIELRNASFPTHVVEVEAGASMQAQIDHRFVASSSTTPP